MNGVAITCHSYLALPHVAEVICVVTLKFFTSRPLQGADHRRGRREHRPRPDRGLGEGKLSLSVEFYDGGRQAEVHIFRKIFR